MGDNRAFTPVLETWCAGRDSNPHCLPSEGSASCQLGYRRKKLVLPASLELASPPYQSGDLPHDREERIGARSIESNVHLSRYKPEALPVELCGRVRRACPVHAFEIARAGLARFAPSKLVLAAGVEPTTSRLRSVCTAIVLRQQSFASPETSARVGSTGRGSALCTGAPSLKTLSFTQQYSRARAFERERFSRTHPFGCERFSRTRTL
jgi:hypothetical protein